MATTPNTLLIPLLLLLLNPTTATSTPPKAAVPPVVPVVEGIVYCQKCLTYGTWSLTAAEPIASATVGVICKDHRRRVSYYKACKTDDNGYFWAELKGFKMHNYFLDHPLHSCSVRLVSSPLKTCNVLTNINYGLNGAPLRYEDKKIMEKNYEAVVYAAGPLAFRPAVCVPHGGDSDGDGDGED
ncbi:non-classical arabinogalactan protein 30 [Andrographis paniculata]|uniref:non-classical arabinogalactan protein 30 n=1 Tax=Andrographis paniculata TaxID=175694 RepID=UPI0021E8A871|nr:non-classical arabinogalactan protein 30 [Andrographis paniculata]